MLDLEATNENVNDKLKSLIMLPHSLDFHGNKNYMKSEEIFTRSFSIKQQLINTYHIHYGEQITFQISVTVIFR